MSTDTDKRLELYDVDGTLNTIDVLAALEGRGGLEIQHYLIAAADLVAEKTGLPQTEVFDGIKAAILEIFPNRMNARYWGKFPATDGMLVPICPAVDYYLLVPPAIELFLKSRLAEETDEAAKTKINTFLRSSWRYPLYKAGSAAASPYEHIEGDAVGVLEGRLRKNALLALITNSATDKVIALLRRAGFERYIKLDGVERGRIGVVGDAKKFQVDVSIPRSPTSHFDLYGCGSHPVEIDLRRTTYRRRVAGLMAQCGAEEVFMATDIPELDAYPLEAWYGNHAMHGMKINPTSAPQSIVAAAINLRARISDRLADLVRDL